MYKPKAGDRVEFVGDGWYIGGLLRGDKGIVKAKPATLYVSWSNTINTWDSIPPWSLCRLLDEGVGTASPMQQWEDACHIFYRSVSHSIDWRAHTHELHSRHGELFPPKLPKIKGVEEVSPMRRWIHACFHIESDDKVDLAHKLHYRHVELFPPEAPKIKVCPKCGCPETALRYCSGASSICFAVHGFEGEHLHYTCRRCDYEWLDVCLDAK